MKDNFDGEYPLKILVGYNSTSSSHSVGNVYFNSEAEENLQNVFRKMSGKN